MRRRYFVFLLFSCLFSASVLADWAPVVVQDSLKQRYPQAQDIAWSQDHEYYVADFEHQGWDTRVWLDAEGRWVMTQTDWQTMDEAPAAVFNAFSAGTYANWQVQDVVWVEFPHWQPIVAIEVGDFNLPTKYQLLYTPDGRLIRARDVTNLYNVLGATTFL